MGLDVVELFAGVGGFRRGLEEADGEFYRTRWFNQWEPATKTMQHAHAIYAARFHPDGDAPEYSNHDIFDVTANHLDAIPEHDLLVGGFPCQDYSVATTLDKSRAIEGPKGKLWWAIDAIIEKKRPAYVLLENVNTLITKPSKQRGRSFGVILSCLHKRGYHVEWRVINAAEAGYAQRRRRVFIFAAREDTGVADWMAKNAADADYLPATGFFGKQFPGAHPTGPAGKLREYDIDIDPHEVSTRFTARFESAGVMIDGRCLTRRVDFRDPAPRKLYTPGAKDNILEDGDVHERFFIDETRWDEWEHQKGPKAIARTVNKGTPEEHTYWFKEGGMAAIDEWDKPGRTILTSEANKTPNRSTHIVIDPATGRKRFLTPLECERLNGFPDNWTDVPGVTDRWRYFTMGNALVVGLVEQMGLRLKELSLRLDPRVTKSPLQSITKTQISKR